MGDEESGSASEEYSFEYSDASMEDAEVDSNIENQYYAAKDLVASDADGALAGFSAVLQLESTKGDKGEWGFKALKQLVKLHCQRGGYEQMMQYYQTLLSYTASAVTKTVGEQGILAVLDDMSTEASADYLESIYVMTLKYLGDGQQNERLWARTNIKLGTLYQSTGNYGRLAKLLRELTQYCMLPGAMQGRRLGEGECKVGGDPLEAPSIHSFDPRKGSQLLEVNALTIRMYTSLKDHRKLKQIYERSLQIRSAIPHPRIMGIIRECGGKMHLQARNWERARSDFFEAFKNYDEAGLPRRTQCLKYLALANMLMESPINVFDSHEAKPFERHPEVAAMTALVRAFESGSVRDFENIFRLRGRDIVGDDEFIRGVVSDLLRTMRTQVVLKIILPYTRIGLPFISRELNIPERDVEDLLVTLILDKRISGHLDQVQKLLVLDRNRRAAAERRRYRALEQWGLRLEGLHQSLLAKLGNGSIEYL